MTSRFETQSRAGWTALSVAIAFPSLLTWAYFVALRGYPAGVQQLTYLVGKTIQFSLPLALAAWLLITQGRRQPRTAMKESIREFLDAFRPFPWSESIRGNVVWGILFGGLVSFAMLLIYKLALVKQPMFLELADVAREKVLELGLSSTGKYLSLGAFYTLGHSLLEEYYWRWCVFRNLCQATSIAMANLVSSLGFMAHHVILLSVYLGWDNPLTYLFSAGVAVGGMVWAALYYQRGSLWGCWLSHGMIDAAIFAVGYDLLHRSPQSSMG